MHTLKCTKELRAFNTAVDVFAGCAPKKTSSKVLCALSTGSQVHLRSESKRTLVTVKNILHGSFKILAITVLEYSKYYDSHSYWMFNNNNKQIEETKRFGKCL